MAPHHRRDNYFEVPNFANFINAINGVKMSGILKVQYGLLGRSLNHVFSKVRLGHLVEGETPLRYVTVTDVGAPCFRIHALLCF